MSNRIAVFEDGVVQQLASPTELYEHPSNAFVAAFIGENNRLVGDVAAVDGKECDVRLDTGDVIRASAVNIGGVGSKTTLSLRPERVVIMTDPNAANGATPNVFEAEVMELIYLGDHIRTRVRLCGNDEFIVKVPNVAGERELTVGRHVHIGWSVEDCHALDA